MLPSPLAPWQHAAPVAYLCEALRGSVSASLEPQSVAALVGNVPELSAPELSRLQAAGGLSAHRQSLALAFGTRSQPPPAPP